MSTFPLYAHPEVKETWNVPMAGHTRFTWEYDDHRQKLLALYQKGKDKQWDAQKRIDWSLGIDRGNPLGALPEHAPIYGSKTWDKISGDEKAVKEFSLHLTSWQFSQFLHGEQGAMICAARITESVPDLDSKFYAATQVMDEARHAEAYAKYLQEKVGLVYPINPHLKLLLDQTLSDSRWDMPYLGMQVLIEGVALAAFGLLRDMTTSPLAKQILAYIMEDEARHVAFGRLALSAYYKELTQKELDEREEFVVEGCYLLRDRFQAEEVWRNLGYDVKECIEFTTHAPLMQMYRSLLFNRIVPCVKSIGLWGPRVQKAYADMGVLGAAEIDLDALMRNDEEIAQSVDAERDELAKRRAQIDQVVALGAAE